MAKTAPMKGRGRPASKVAKKPKAKAGGQMTSKRWKELQAGMKEKWPQPSYMEPEPGRLHTNYRDETYSVVSCWKAETRIAYRPHAKAPGSKSHARYERYSKAKTVGEALRLGSFPVDWCWDYERGFIKVFGPVREELLDISKVPDRKSLTAVDLVVHRWYKRELAKRLGLKVQDLEVDKLFGESLLMRGHRLVAQKKAREALERADRTGRRITDTDVESVLMQWAFYRNPNRVNVIPDGQDWVFSDTLGLVRDRIGDIHLTPPTSLYPEVVQVLTRFLTDRLPPECKHFVFSSINLNCNYAAKLHRDGNNFGPSFISAFGDFKGGQLNYWPEDDRHKQKLEQLKAKDQMTIPLKGNLLMFNGNCGHSVNDFTGQRFSVVYFTVGCHASADPKDKAFMEDLGVPFPAKDADPYTLLRPPRGYGSGKEAVATPARSGGRLPAFRLYKQSALDSARFVKPKVSKAARTAVRKGAAFAKKRLAAAFKGKKAAAH